MGDSHNLQGSDRQAIRCAIYARYSCELQRPTSIEDQVRKCIQECERHQGWTILKDWVMSDEEVSGRSMTGRGGLKSLKEAVKKNPRPFDCMLIDDTSRFGRNLGDVLKLAEFFAHCGVSLHFVSPPLNSPDPNFRQLLIFKGMMDEQFSTDLAVKVLRGLEGQVRRGFNAGSACFGYKNQAVPDPAGKGDGIAGMRLEIIPDQAEVALRIFKEYASGSSFATIARGLRADKIQAPKPPRKNSVRVWAADSIGDLLRNKKYIGINEWHRTEQSIDPETGRSVTRKRPQEKWVRHQNPEWRIVSDELWEKVQEQLQLKRRIGLPKIGGQNRTERSRKYLFSGQLCCGTCGGPLKIIDGTAGGTTVWYGCPARYKAACTSSLRIRRDHLEERFLGWLTRDLLQGDRLEQAVSSLYAGVQKRVLELHAEAQKNAVQAPELRKELAQKKLEAYNITDIMATMGRNSSPILQSRLRSTEERIKEIEVQLSRINEPDSVASFAVDEIKEHLLSKLGNLQAMLTTAPPLVARQILGRYIRKITLNLIPHPERKSRQLRVTVEFELLGGGEPSVLLTGRGDCRPHGSDLMQACRD
jgi:site-specific DNA recombinase